MSSSGTQGRLGDLFEAYGRWLVRNRAICSLLFVVISAIIGVQAVQKVAKDGPPVDFTPQAMFLNDGPEVQHQRAVEEVFGVEDTTLALMVEGDLTSHESIAYLRNLHSVLEATPGVVRVDSLVNIEINMGEGEWLDMANPLDRVPSEEALERINADPLIQGLLLSEDQRLTVFRVRLEAIEEIAQLAPIVKGVIHNAHELERPEGMEIHQAGVPWVRTEIVDLMMADNLRFLPWCVVMFAGTICVLFRRFWLGIAPLVAVNIASAWAVGTLIIGGAVFNILSILVPVLVIIIGVADGIHVVGRYREELAQTPTDRETAMGRTTRAMMVACFLTTFTTAAGFGSLTFADTPVIADFGRHAAVAIMICFVAIMLVVPTLISWVPLNRVLPPRQPVREGLEAKMLAGLHIVVKNRPKLILAATLLLIAFAGWLGRDVRTNSFLLEMYADDHPTAVSTRLANDKLGGVIPSYFHLEGPPGSMLEPEVLHKMSALQEAMNEEEPFLWTRSSVDALTYLHETIMDDPEAGIPDQPDQIAQLLWVADMGDGGPMLGDDIPLGHLVDETRSNTRILALMNDSGGQAYNESRARLEAKADELFGHTNITAKITGDGIIAASLVNSLISDLLQSMSMVMVVIAITMFVLLRNLRLTLISLLPNFVPLIFIVAGLGLMNSDLQTSNIVTFTVALGLAVDDTIHFVVRYAQERRQGHDLEEAIRRSFMGAGHAIVLTSVLLILGFCTLMSSDLTSTRHFGILSAVTMGAAILGDLVLLPALLHLFGRHRTSKTSVMASAQHPR